MERTEIDYSKLVYKSGDNKYFNFTKFGPLSSFYLKLMNGDIGIDAVKLNMEEFKKEIDRLEKKRAKKKALQKNKEDVLKKANALYNGLNIIVDAFEKGIFEQEGRARIDVYYDLDAYDLIDKELQMFKKILKYDSPNELRNALIDVDEKKYYELKNDIKITQNVLKEETGNEISAKSTRLKKLVNVIKDILNSEIKSTSMPHLEKEESAAQRRNKQGEDLKNLK